MYHIERALKNLGAMVHNKAKVEGCIAEEFKLKEIVYFTRDSETKSRGNNTKQ
jgi:hypothetical protein